MANLKESAKAYIPPQQLKNITDLPVVSVELDVVEKTFKEGTTEQYTSFVVVIDGEDYKVPKTVLADLKAILESKPGLKSFKVTKTGTGMNTNYTVIPLE